MPLERLGSVPITAELGIEVKLNPDQRGTIITWPTPLSGKEFVRKASEMVSIYPGFDWGSEVVCNSKNDDVLHVISPEEYVRNDDYRDAEEGTFVVKFNAGPPEGGGFSIATRIDNGQTRLEGSFGMHYLDQDIANWFIEETIIPEGKGKSAEIAHLPFAPQS